MENKTLLEQQMEALKELHNYMQKLIPAVESIVIELREAKKSDTNELIDAIIKGINWTIQVINHTMELVNEKEEVFDKVSLNNDIYLLSKAVIEKNDDLRIAELFEKKILPFLFLVNAQVAVITKSAS